MTPSLSAVMLTFISSAMPVQTTNEPHAWPKMPTEIEYSLSQATGAFFGTLHLYDVERPLPNIGIVSGRIVPETLVWGKLPQVPIELGRGDFLIHGGSGGGFGAWNSVLPSLLWESSEDRSVLILVVFMSQDGKPRVLCVARAARGDNGHVPPAKDFLMIQKLEAMPKDGVLRDALIGVTSEAKSSELLWSYALRKLVKLDDDPGRRFDNVFSVKLQKTALPRRISYARQVLSYSEHTSDSAQVTLQRSLIMVEQAPNSRTAFMGLTLLTNPQLLRLAKLTKLEKRNLHVRLTELLASSTHPLQNLDDRQRNAVDKLLRQLLDE